MYNYQTFPFSLFPFSTPTIAANISSDDTPAQITNITDPQKLLFSLNMNSITKLSSSNYLTWSHQIRLFLDGHELSQFIHDSPPIPPATIIVNDTSSPNPAYNSWIRQDKLIFVALLTTITTPLQPLVTSATTTSEAWTILSRTYGHSTRRQIRDQLKNSIKGLKTIDQYMQHVTSKVDQLALLGKTTDHEDLIEYILKGLPQEYSTIVDSVNNCETPISLEEIHEKLLNHEATLLCNIATCSSSASSPANNLYRTQSTMTSESTSDHPMETEEVILKISGAILHLIDRSYTVEIACGDLEILRFVQGEITVAVFARVADIIQWPLTKDEPAVKVDESHYLFLDSSNNEGDMLIYRITIDSKGQYPLLEELDRILTDYSSFTVKENNALNLTAAEVEKQCMAHWTNLAPNVEDYSGFAAKLIAAGSGRLIKGIFWCGDVTIDRLMWGNDFMKRRLTKAEKEREVSSATLTILKRVRKMTEMTEKVANGAISGIIKYFILLLSLVVNNKAGKKLFSLPPVEVVLATLDGFNKVFDAVEIAGRNVMKTYSTVITEIVDHKYGANTEPATNEVFKAAGHALGTVWTVLNIRQVLNLKSAMKPSTLAKTTIKTAAI